VAQTPVSRFRAYATGQADLSPGVYFIGQLQRFVETTDFTTGAVSFSCAMDYTTQAVRAIPPANVCQDCEFAFEVDITFRQDFGIVFAGQPSVCGNYFNSVGGAGVNVPNISVAYDEASSTMLYQSGGVWEVYTYDTTRAVNGPQFGWTKTFFQQYYY
jgi:hypothetical protein